MGLLLILVFGATLGVVMGAGRALSGRPDPVRARLQDLAARLVAASGAPAAPEGRTSPTQSTTAAPAGGSWKGRPRGMQLELLRAGLKVRPAEYWAATAAVAGLLGALGLLSPAPVLWVPVFGLTGIFVPRAVLKHLQAARVRKFENQMADALALVASSLRSGYSFLRAIQVVGQEMPDPIAEECRRVVAESNLGAPVEQALGRVVDRVPSYDLELVVTAVYIQIQVGGNLAQILDTISATIRERVRNQREIAALTAEGKLSGIVCVAMPPVMALFLMLVNPGYLKPLFTEPLGILMLVGAAVLQLLGIIWTRALVKIDV